MYEQAIKYLYEGVAECECIMYDLSRDLEDNPLCVVNINLHNDWKSRRKEMLLAIECLEEDNR